MVRRPGRAIRALPHEVHAMRENKGPFPPSLNAVSDYKLCCKRYGKPIICDDRFAHIQFESCCRELPRQLFEPIIKRWKIDPVHVIRHWPVMAHAASQYVFLQREFNESEAEASPAHVREMLVGIQKSAQHLSNALEQLREMSDRLRDGTAPAASAHLSWIDQLIAQGMAGHPTDEVDEEFSLVVVDSARSDFITCLANVEAAARRAREGFDPSYWSVLALRKTARFEPWLGWRGRFGKASPNESRALTRLAASGGLTSSRSYRN
jgi:hypothetical protein